MERPVTASTMRAARRVQLPRSVMPKTLNKPIVNNMDSRCALELKGFLNCLAANDYEETKCVGYFQKMRNCLYEPETVRRAERERRGRERRN